VRVVELHQVHNGRDQHWHKWHAVGLVTNDVLYPVQTDLVVVFQIWIDEHFQKKVDCKGWVLVLFAQVEFVDWDQ
jgi:hypothetical protein